VSGKKNIAGALPVFLFFSLTTALLAQEKEPPVVSAPAGKAPSDAVVLFDGKDLSGWTYKDGRPAGWIVADGAMTVNGGHIMSKKEFGDHQLHVEFATPSPATGDGQARGNSGVYLQGMYELQVLDSYENKTSVKGMCGAIYQQYTPLVNASRKPGEWQTYDIIFHAPKFDSAGNVIEKAIITVLYNGVLILDHVSISPTPGRLKENESPRGPVFLQDHRHPVKYRNIWVRELK